MAVIHLLNAFGAQCIVFDPYLNKNLKNDNFTIASSLDELYEKADVISLHCPANKENFHLLNKDDFQKMKNGDKEAEQKLIEHNLRLVAHVTKKYYSLTADSDDLISIGTIGLIKAVSSFDSDKGIRLATYAARCIDNEILMYFRGAKKTVQDVYISDPIDTDKEGNTLTLVDVLTDDTNIVEELDTKLNLEKLKQYLKDTLQPRELHIIDLRYGLSRGEELTQREVAELLGISRSYVSRIEKKALSKLRERFK
jgi:RNA polymerase sporulation-specific sigma factor